MGTVIALPGSVNGRLPCPEETKDQSLLPATSSSGSGNLDRYRRMIDCESFDKIWEFLCSLGVNIQKFEELLFAIIERLGSGIGLATAEPKGHVTTKDFAARFGLKPETVEKYCREGKIIATKTIVGRGNTGEWRISQAEIRRYEEDGLFRKDNPPRQYPRKGE